MHVYLFSPMYFQEVVDRWHYYPPPDNGSYSYPWLWYDGNPHGGWVDSTWHAKIDSRLTVPASVTITMWGTYNTGTGNGTIYARYRNDSTASITGRALFVITEDSIYYAGTNGDCWHNHVARDYLPDQNGQVITIAPGDSVVISRSFTIESGWNANRCQILTWLQNDNMLPDSTKPIYQGSIKKVTDLVAIAETEDHARGAVRILAYPNPARDLVIFSVDKPIGNGFGFEIYDLAGRIVNTLYGDNNKTRKNLEWRIPKWLKKGVYFIKYHNKNEIGWGKLVITG
jgi:hypothetical protein